MGEGGGADRRRPVGAELGPGGVHVRVWAPSHAQVTLLTPEGRAVPLDAEPGGYHAAPIPDFRDGALYGFRLGDEEVMRPDPASRFQPEGPDGWSQVVDPGAFPWTDEAWAGLTLPGQIFYELHVGTFTPEGTWAAATAELPRLRDLGVTAVEVMPVAEWAGRWGWGYDGVALFAPFHRYGTPDDMRRFVERAHALGLGVILDVVYNHLGGEGDHLSAFAPEFLSGENGTDWGAEPDFGEPAVRDLILANVAAWVEEFHLDGLRIDATQNMTDASPEHILSAITRTARAVARWPILVIGENEPQDARLLRPLAEGGHGMDAVWADDVHHSAFVALTGRGGAYMADYSGGPQELLSAFRRGWLFQGQRSSGQPEGRGTPALDQPPRRFVAFLENHDQVANTGTGERLLSRTSPGRLRAMTALWLLAPTTPLLFQGQETGSERPFTYFLDAGEGTRDAVREGRLESMGRFSHLGAPEMRDRHPDPADEATFLACKLRPPSTERERQAERLHRDLLRLRREDPAVRLQGEEGMEGAVIGPEALLLRVFANGADRLLLVNLGPDLAHESLAEPLLAPPREGPWEVLWSSEHPDYGGLGTPRVLSGEGGLFLPGHAAVLLGAGARQGRSAVGATGGPVG